MRCCQLLRGHSECPGEVERQPLSPRPPLDTFSGYALGRTHHGDSTDELARVSSLIVGQSQFDILDLPRGFLRLLLNLFLHLIDLAAPAGSDGMAERLQPSADV